MTSPAPLFSFVFITANRCNLLLEALASVDHLPSPHPYEVVIVDNGSGDDTRAQVARQYPHFQLVAMSENKGVAEGRNIGFAQTRGKYVIFIDDDATLASRDILNTLESRFAANEKLAVVAFKIVNETSGHVLSHEFPMRHYREENIRKEQLVGYFIGCGFAVRRECFLETGGFFEKMTYALEEVDLSYRLLDRSLDILYCPEIVIRHKTPPEVRRQGPWYYHFIRSRIWMALRNLPFWAAVPHLLIWQTYLIWPAARSGNFRPYLRGVADGWRGAGMALSGRQPIRFKTAVRIWWDLSGRLFY